ncbi:hypothetical protein [Polyangium mundeleinium]|uniref:Uncharacterized protein n=1 Tax=Polyangium mundeleinium TaxID=2995306 RepID=A0ABT5EMV2_9BACT|nr:hypothetical protein [Polyangium mundeleinium]MDC0742679.1 hypothetical protein [Polyangium mundeleinium]
MMSARSIFVIACSFLALNVFACATGSTGGVGGGGGEGGDDWGGPGPSSSSSSSGSGGSGGSGGGGVPMTTCDMNSMDCSTCSACSGTTADGLCNAETQACNNSIDCGDFLTCIDGCADGDSACYTSCETAYPTGYSIFNDYASCVICNDCYVRCNGADSCI